MVGRLSPAFCPKSWGLLLKRSCGPVNWFIAVPHLPQHRSATSNASHCKQLSQELNFPTIYPLPQGGFFMGGEKPLQNMLLCQRKGLRKAGDFTNIRQLLTKVSNCLFWSRLSIIRNWHGTGREGQIPFDTLKKCSQG